jgi:hypothetical protein
MDSFAGFDLKALAGVLEEIEEHHAQVRGEGFDLVGCRCGASYTDSEDCYVASRNHLREVIVGGLLRELSAPCQFCRGSGVGAHDDPCRDCEGFGLTLFPLPPMQYREPDGSVWEVKGVWGDSAFVLPRA